MEVPRSLIEFPRVFPDEEACWQALRRMRWPEGFCCPRCGHRESYALPARRLEQCRFCRHQVSPTAGTVFHKTRTSLRVWFLALFFVARHKKGISALQFQRDAGLGSYQTAWTLLHKVRSALGAREGAGLSGLVEVDEAYVGGRGEEGVRGRQKGRKAVVAGAVESHGECAGAARLEVVPGASEEDLAPFVRGAVHLSEATVLSDGWKSYGAVLRGLGGRHRPEVQGDPKRAGKILPWVHTVFSNLKAWLWGTFHGVSKKHLPLYLQEFTYRFDRRWRENELFGFVLRRLATGAPFPYRALVAEQVG